MREHFGTLLKVFLQTTSNHSSVMNLLNIIGSSPRFYNEITRICQMPKELEKGTFHSGGVDKIRKRAEKQMIYFHNGKHFFALKY